MDIFCYEKPEIHRNTTSAAFVDGTELWFYVSTVILQHSNFVTFAEEHGMMFKYLTYLVRFVICCLKYGVINDELYDRIRCSELRKWHFRGSNLKNFPGGNAPGPP